MLREEIDAELRRRILARHPDYQRAAILGDGGDPANAMLLDIERLRACADHLLAMVPIPVQYRSDHHWNGYPPGFRPWVQQAVPAAPQYAPAPAPSVVVVNPPGNSQHVTMSPPGVTVQPPHTATYASAPQPMPPGMVPAFPGGAPVPEYYPQMPAAVAYPSSHAPATPVARPSAAMPAAPRAADPVPALPPEVWSAAKEAGYAICKAAMDGDADAIARIAPIAERQGVSVTEFCQGYANERAFALNRHNEINGVAA